MRKHIIKEMKNILVDHNNKTRTFGIEIANMHKLKKKNVYFYSLAIGTIYSIIVFFTVSSTKGLQQHVLQLT